MTKKRAKTNAERQAEYRARRYNAGPKGDPEYRINTWVSSEAHHAFERLAAHYAVTKRELLELLLVKADNDICQTFSGPEFEQYITRNITQ